MMSVNACHCKHHISTAGKADLHPKKVTHKKSTGAKKVTFLEEKNGKRKCTSRSKNQSNN